MDNNKRIKSVRTKLIVSTVILVSVILLWTSYENPATELAAFSFTPLPLVVAFTLAVFLHSSFTYIMLKSNNKLSFADKKLSWWQVLIGILVIISMLIFLNIFAN